MKEKNYHTRTSLCTFKKLATSGLSTMPSLQSYTPEAGPQNRMCSLQTRDMSKCQPSALTHQHWPLTRPPPFVTPWILSTHHEPATCEDVKNKAKRKLHLQVQSVVVSSSPSPGVKQWGTTCLRKTSGPTLATHAEKPCVNVSSSSRACGDFPFCS